MAMHLESPQFIPTPLSERSPSKKKTKEAVYANFSDSIAFETSRGESALSETEIILENENHGLADSLQLLLTKYGERTNEVKLEDGSTKFNKNTMWTNVAGDRAYIVEQTQSTSGERANLNVGTFFVDESGKWTEDARVVINPDDGTARFGISGISLSGNKSDMDIVYFGDANKRLKDTFGEDHFTQSSYVDDQAIEQAISKVLVEVNSDIENLKKPSARLAKLGRKALSKLLR